MTREVRWTLAALSELDASIDYIAAHDERAAETVKRRVQEAVERLARYHTGRPSRVAGHFEKPVSKTRLTLCYSVTSDTLLVVRCIHQSRYWPQNEWPSKVR